MLALEARAWAADSLRLDVGDAYTSFTRLRSDTLAMILSAAYPDRLVSKTWWFPVVGRVPYRGYFDLADAQDAQRELEEEGLDTYLRPTAAFSTLGWFADPLLSTLLRQDEVDLVESILHELSHGHLWAPGSVTFNESWATFVGRAGAADFFCRRAGGGPDTVKCERARARWRDYQRYSRFMDGLVADLTELYGRVDLPTEAKLARRQEVFDAARARFRQDVQPTFESVTFSGFLTLPLNNATLLASMRYYHRLPDFQALLDAHGGDLAAAVAALEAGVDDVDDPFDLLPRGSEPGG